MSFSIQKKELENFRFKTLFIARIIFWLFRLLKSSWRKHEAKFPDLIEKRLNDRKPVLVAHWHEDEWALLGVWANKGAHTLVSVSEDGGVMTRFLELFGWRVSRGSSSKRGAVGLLSLIKSVKKSEYPLVTMAVDGPRGPRRRAKLGVLKMAAALDAPVLVMAAATSKRIVFKKSWSHAFLPLPFARLNVVYPNFLTAEEIQIAFERDDTAELVYKLEEYLKSAKKLAAESLLT